MANTTTGPLSAGSQGSFPQTGPLSMAEIVKLPVQASIAILSRYAAGRVNPYTVLVCESLCRGFQLTAQGRANIETAIASLTTVGAVGTALEFGFGVEDLTRSMAKSEQGTIVLVLCAALREVYSLDISTEVLLEMARLSKVGGEWMPSSLEWKAMLQACSGVLAATRFGVRAEVLMQLANEGQRLGAFQRLEATPQDLRDCSSPKSIAEALIAMAAVSRNEMQSITLVGGPDTGWLAAVAEWVLDLNISISDSQGEVIYTNINGTESAQIEIIYGRQATDLQDVVVQGRTYVLKEISEILGKEAKTSIATTVSGRLEWKTALRSTFLSDFKKLMESLPSTLGTLLGSAARMFRAVAQSDASFPLAYRTACTSYCDQSFGSGFVINTLTWFPELVKLRDHMEEAVAKPLRDAKLEYEASIARLRQFCGCRACSCPSNGFEFDNDIEMTPVPDSASDGTGRSGSPSDVGDDADDWDPDRYCAVIIAETIIVLSRALANVSLDDANILPMRSGFEKAYGRQLTMRRSAVSGRQALNDLGPFAFCMDFDANFSFGLRENDYGTGVRLDLILELFTGERPSVSPDGVSAVCSRGLCAYFGILRDVSFPRSGVGAVGIIPGRIQYEKKSYMTLEDRHIIQNEDSDLTIQNLVRNGGDFSTLELSVKESSTALECLIQLPRPAAPAEMVVAGPANLADLVAARRGLVHCKQSRGGGRKPCQRMEGLTSEERRRLKDEGGCITMDWMRDGSDAWFFHCQDPLVTQVALVYCAARYISRAAIFIVDSECVDCCLRTLAGIETVGDVYFFYIAA